MTCLYGFENSGTQQLGLRNPFPSGGTTYSSDWDLVSQSLSHWQTTTTSVAPHALFSSHFNQEGTRDSACSGIFPSHIDIDSGRSERPLYIHPSIGSIDSYQHVSLDSIRSYVLPGAAFLRLEQDSLRSDNVLGPTYHFPSHVQPFPPYSFKHLLFDDFRGLNQGGSDAVPYVAKDNRSVSESLQTRNRKKVTIACQHCYESRSGCTSTRPCSRCMRLGLPDCKDRKVGREVKRTPKKKPPKKKIMKGRACQGCFVSKSACDVKRPCSRCIRLGLPNCQDRQLTTKAMKVGRKKLSQYLLTTNQTDSDFAEKIGITKNYLQGLLRGKFSFRERLAKRIEEETGGKVSKEGLLIP